MPDPTDPPDRRHPRGAGRTCSTRRSSGPITDLGMVRSIEVDRLAGRRVGIDLTTPGCPLKDTLTRDVTRGGRDRRRASTTSSRRVRRDVGGAARRRCGRCCAAPDAEPVIPFAQPRLADQGVRDRVGQGRRRQVVRHGQPRGRDGGRRAEGRHRRRRHLRLLDPPDARRHAAADAGRRHAAAARGVRRPRRLDRHVRAARAAGRVARADAAPRAAAVPRGRVLGRPRRAPARPAARHRRHRHLGGAAAAELRDRRRHHAAARRRRGGRARRARSPCRPGSTWSASWRTCRGSSSPTARGSSCSGRVAGSASPTTSRRLTGGDVPLLGQVPLDVRLREAGDGGHPVVLSDPGLAAAGADDVAALAALRPPAALAATHVVASQARSHVRRDVRGDAASASAAGTARVRTPRRIGDVRTPAGSSCGVRRRVLDSV